MADRVLRAKKWGVAVLVSIGLAGCRVSTPVQSTVLDSSNAKEGSLEQLAWADYQSARAEYEAAWKELAALRIEAQQSQSRVEAVSQQLKSLESARASEAEAFKEKSAALEASVSKSKR